MLLIGQDVGVFRAIYVENTDSVPEQYIALAATIQRRFTTNPATIRTFKT